MPTAHAAPGQRLQAGHREGPSPALPVVARVDGDHVDLAQDRGAVPVDLGPAGPDEAVARRDRRRPGSRRARPSRRPGARGAARRSSRPVRGGRRRPGCWCRPRPPRRARARRAGSPAAGSPARRRPAGGGAPASGAGRARGRTRGPGRGRRRPVRPRMAQRWTAAAGGDPATARPISAEVTRSVRPGVTAPAPASATTWTTVEPSRAGESTASPASPPSGAGQDDAPVGAALPRAGDGGQLRLGESRVAVGRGGAVEQCRRARRGPRRAARSSSATSEVHAGQRNPVP